VDAPRYQEFPIFMISVVALSVLVTCAFKGTRGSVLAACKRSLVRVQVRPPKKSISSDALFGGCPRLN
jgi:hypothetical protein